MNWPEEEARKFVKMVSEYPAIFNPKDTNFTNMILRESIWCGIGQKLNRNTSELKKCWRNLKDGFVRFKKKQKECEEINERSNYKIYNIMSFLENIVDENYGKTIITSGAKITTDETKKTPEPLKGKLPEDLCILGMEQVVFNKPIETHRKPKGRRTMNADINRTNVVNNVTSTTDLREIHTRKPVKRPTRIFICEEEPEKEKEDLVLPSPIPPFKIRRRRFSNEQIRPKNNHCTKNGNADNNSEHTDKEPVVVDVDNDPLVLDLTTESTANVTNGNNVAHIEVLDVRSPENDAFAAVDDNSMDSKDSKEEDKDIINGDAKEEPTFDDEVIIHFAKHIKQVLTKLPPLLKIKARQEIFEVLTKYELMALGVNKINLSSCKPSSSSETIVSKIKLENYTVAMETAIEIEADNNNDVIELKEDAERNKPKDS